MAVFYTIVQHSSSKIHLICLKFLNKIFIKNNGVYKQSSIVRPTRTRHRVSAMNYCMIIKTVDRSMLQSNVLNLFSSPRKLQNFCLYRSKSIHSTVTIDKYNTQNIYRELYRELYRETNAEEWLLFHPLRLLIIILTSIVILSFCRQGAPRDKEN